MFLVNHISEQIFKEKNFKKVALEIKHILRLSRMKEYASPENKTSIRAHRLLALKFSFLQQKRLNQRKTAF